MNLKFQFAANFRKVVMISVLIFLTTSGVCFGQSRDEPLVVVRNGKYGYIDHGGRIVIEPQFVWADDFWRGLGTVYVCGQYLSIDSSGLLQPLRIAIAGQLEAKQVGQKFGFVDGHDQFKIKPIFDAVLPFSDGLAAVKVGEKWGFVDASGDQIIKPQFQNAFYFREGVAVAKLDSRYALIDKSGKVLASGFDFTDLIADGRVPASKDGKSGYLDLRGTIVIPFDYEAARNFSGGLAAAEKRGKWGYIDRDGRLVIPFKFDHAGQFSNHLAPAKLGGRSGFINKFGNFVYDLPFRYAPGFLSGDNDKDLFVAEANVSRFWTDDNKFG